MISSEQLKKALFTIEKLAKLQSGTQKCLFNTVEITASWFSKKKDKKKEKKMMICPANLVASIAVGFGCWWLFAFLLLLSLKNTRNSNLILSQAVNNKYMCK